MRNLLSVLLLYMLAISGTALVLPHNFAFFATTSPSFSFALAATKSNNDPTVDEKRTDGSRRKALQAVIFTAGSLAVPFGMSAAAEAQEEDSNIFAPAFVQQYQDFTATPNGWSYRDVNKGNGATAALGDRAVFDWSGYTIGYFGRPFQAKGGPQGGAFDKDNLDYARVVLGSNSIVPALEQALEGMQPGGVRQVVVPYRAGLSYPPNDPSHDRVGPKPTTFSGQRALNFVLDNPRIDRTLLFNVKLIRVDKPNGKGGFVRG